MIWYTMWYDMICDVIWYDIWCDMIYDVIWYDIWCEQRANAESKGTSLGMWVMAHWVQTLAEQCEKTWVLGLQNLGGRQRAHLWRQRARLWPLRSRGRGRVPRVSCCGLGRVGKLLVQHETLPKQIRWGTVREDTWEQLQDSLCVHTYMWPCTHTWKVHRNGFL